MCTEDKRRADIHGRMIGSKGERCALPHKNTLKVLVK